MDGKISEDFIKGLETARKLLKTKEDDDKLMEDYFSGKLGTQ